MQVLVVGKSGQLARHLASRIPDAIFLSRKELDMLDSSLVYKKIAGLDVDLIINATAYTDTKLAESESGDAYAVNAYSVAEIARIAKNKNIPFVHVSTDYVFDGEANAPYQEGSEANPQNIYGASKLLGEELAMRIWKKTIVIRTSWVFSEFGNNFVKTILTASLERESLDIVSNQIGSPTYAGNLADTIVKIKNIIENKNTVASNKKIEYGIYHYVDKDSCSWFDFANEIVRKAKKIGYNTKVKEINSVHSDSWVSPIKRPENGVLSCKKINKNMLIEQKSWQEGLDVVLTKLYQDDFQKN